MREVLYKGLRLDTHEWIEGVPIFYRAGQVGIAQIHPKTRVLPRDEAAGLWTISHLFCPKIDPNTLCEWTGAYDGTKWEELSSVEQETFLQSHEQKEWKGKKIFEGDTLYFDSPYKEPAWKDYSGEFVVEFNGYKFICDNFYCPYYDDAADAFSEGTYCLKVIGNIHERK